LRGGASQNSWELKGRIKEDAIWFHHFDSLASLFEGQKILVLAKQAQSPVGSIENVIYQTTRRVASRLRHPGNPKRPAAKVKTNHVLFISPSPGSTGLLAGFCMTTHL